MMDMFLLEVRDQKARRQVLYVDYLITSRASVRGDPSESSGNGAFCTLAEEGTEPIEERLQYDTNTIEECVVQGHAHQSHSPSQSAIKRVRLWQSRPHLTASTTTIKRES